MRRFAPLIVLACAATSAEAQAGRQALAAGTDSYLLADYQHAVPLLSLGLDPAVGAHDRPWVLGVERLADVLLVLRQDSLAATWLRWATRLAPDFAVDEEVVPPAVLRAARAARAFVDATPQDAFVSQTVFRWPATFRAADPGTVRLSAATIPITARIGADQFLRGGESRTLPPGSYEVVVSAPGYLPTRLTIELLPGVETLVRVSLLPETAGLLYVSARPWGTVFIDGQRIGYTSVTAHRLLPGSHTVRLERDGGPTTDTTITVAERRPVRLSWIARRDTVGEARLDNALSALDAGDIEGGVEMLQLFLPARQPSAGATARAVALARLAEATWSLHARDSARACLRRMVEIDPFYIPPGDLFNPELWATYEQVRRETPAIAIRAPQDTVMVPVRDLLPVTIAVGRPGDVRLYLRLTTPRSRDSLVAAGSVESVAVARIPLTAPDSAPLPPGVYEIEAELVLPSGVARDLVTLSIERLSADTTPHVAPLAAAVFRPETMRGRLSLRTVLQGVGLGAMAVLVPVVMNNGDVSGRSVPFAAALIGGSIATAEITLTRPTVPIRENVRYNEVLRTQWEGRNRSIAAQNALRLRRTPLRIRVTATP